MQPKERIRPINESVLRKVHGRVLSGLPINVPFPEQGTPLGSLFDNETLGINIDINESLALIMLSGNPVSSLPNNNISSS